MNNVPIELTRVRDLGREVFVVGRMTTTGRLLRVACDRVPFGRFWLDWCAAGQPQPVCFDAKAKTLAFEATAQATDSALRAGIYRSLLPTTDAALTPRLTPERDNE